MEDRPLTVLSQGLVVKDEGETTYGALPTLDTVTNKLMVATSIVLAYGGQVLWVPVRFSTVLISNFAELIATVRRGIARTETGDELGSRVDTKTGDKLGSLVGKELTPLTNPLLMHGCNSRQNWSTQVANSLQQSELVTHPHSAFIVYCVYLQVGLPSANLSA